MTTPLAFGPGKNELWRLPLKSGHSSPVVSGDSIFVTTFDPNANRLSVVAIERPNGKIRWERSPETEEIQRGHPSFNPASGGYAHGRYVAHDESNNTPLCNLFVNLLYNMGIETKSFGTSTGTLEV